MEREKVISSTTGELLSGAIYAYQMADQQFSGALQAAEIGQMRPNHPVSCPMAIPSARRNPDESSCC